MAPTGTSGDDSTDPWEAVSSSEETEARAQLAAQAAAFTSYLAFERDGALFFVGVDSKYGRRLFAGRRLKDSRQLDRVLRALELGRIDLTGSTFLDVGANIGTASIQAVRRFGFSSAVAVEAEPETFRILRANVAVNLLDQVVRTHNAAVSNRVGTGELILGGRGAATHRLAHAGESTEATVAVPLTTVDHLLSQIRLDPVDVSLLWIDVEGWELEVLEGSRSLMQHAVPAVVEFSPGRFATAGAGRLAAFADLLVQTYTHFYDLKARDVSKWGFEPLSALGELPRRRDDKTDLLVVRL